ncbi:MAG: hypothetical protein K9G62_02150 [Alphaproteobacteria bacterium]|nr:hypothetical protein [Alphaproteobacteria bacterium]
MSRIDKLFNHAAFQKKVKSVLGTDISGVAVSPIGGGIHKDCFMLAAEGKKAILKEEAYGRLENPMGFPVDSLLELNVIDETKKLGGNDKIHFPKSFGNFVYDEDEEKFVNYRKIKGPEKVSQLSQSSEISFFILEEYKEGRFVNEEELQKAQAIREEGIKRNSMLWQTVDAEERNDVIVDQEGNMAFIDRGLSSKSKKTFKRLCKHFLDIPPDYIDSDGMINDPYEDFHQEFRF